MTADELLPLIAWAGVGVWLAAVGMLRRRQWRAAAVLHALLSAPFVIPFGVGVAGYVLDPAGYVRQRGAAAAGELPLDAAILALGLVVLGGAVLEWRGRRWPGIVASAVSLGGLAILFYFAYFFRIF